MLNDAGVCYTSRNIDNNGAKRCKYLSEQTLIDRIK